MKKIIIFAAVMILCIVLSACSCKKIQITDVTTADNAESTLPTETYISGSAEESTTENVTLQETMESVTTTETYSTKPSDLTNIPETTSRPETTAVSTSPSLPNPPSTSTPTPGIPSTPGATTTTKAEVTTVPPLHNIVPGSLSYAEFIALPAVEQEAYMNSFGTDMVGIQKFMAWYTESKAKYDAEQAEKETGNGDIDIGDYIDKN